ncbi:MAG: hypothetical protein K9M99_12205 [Candidatus Cloacimonetes bacterium]|nr:hypothetical protein [Candidatus Cloacimonadota bacterium]
MAIIVLPFQGISVIPSGGIGLVVIVNHRLKPMAIIVLPFQGKGNELCYDLNYFTLKGFYNGKPNSHGCNPWTNEQQIKPTLKGLHNNNNHRENLLIME